jgi:hypothetical protein
MTQIPLSLPPPSEPPPRYSLVLVSQLNHQSIITTHHYSSVIFNQWTMDKIEQWYGQINE